MKVILKEDIRTLGKKGAVVNVSDGYAQNYLFPRNLATIADAAAMNEIKSQEAAKAYKIKTQTEAAKEMAKKMESMLVKITASAGADGKFYGAVTTKEISEQLEAQFGILVDKRKIELAEPIKTFGQYEMDVKLYTGITGKLHVLVTEKK
ncbi:MAG TPA: 50S ribosomal protein L9 [Clostridiales bacterium]|jgi:large subunit ribosomal protein L9|nr:50S ribosomal protein L9 [Clostridiales bacterium]HBE13038.1 50S ribosomal protein L9 [Clostridiales bacterium]HCG35856.1 50S ribosomal protein L9 [Clostridiales bacterium]